MKDIQYVSYHERYLGSLLECWNSTLIYDPLSKKRFLDLYVYDENFEADLFILAISGKEVIGFCSGVKRKVSYYTKGTEPDRGWILNMAVREAYQRQGIGQRLYREMEARLGQQGTKSLTLCAYSPNYLAPGIDIRYEKGLSFFRKQGYPKGHDAVSMQRDLWHYTMPSDTQTKLASLQGEGITITTYTSDYYTELMRFLEKEFEPGWKRNVIAALQRNEAEDTVVICVNEQDEVLGYCMRKIDGHESRFGPIGVAEAVRSKGLGGILFDFMMLEMKKQGINYAYFLWTSGPAIRFYERHGMKIYRCYKVMSKEL